MVPLPLLTSSGAGNSWQDLFAQVSSTVQILALAVGPADPSVEEIADELGVPKPWR